MMHGCKCTAWRISPHPTLTLSMLQDLQRWLGRACEIEGRIKAENPSSFCDERDRDHFKVLFELLW